MKVVHLAAGQGTRLRPITEDRPKPLVELGGKSLLERNVETLESAGATEQVIVTGYRSDKLESWPFEKAHNDLYEESEMVYSLFCAAEEFPDDEDLCVSYGDIIYAESVVKALMDCEAPFCVVVDRNWEALWRQRFEGPLDDAETLRLDDSGNVKNIGETPDDYAAIDGQYIGLVKVRNDHVPQFEAAYDGLSEDEAKAIEMTSFIQRLIDGGWTVRAVPIEGKWLEVDKYEDLELYQRFLDDEEDFDHISWLNDGSR